MVGSRETLFAFIKQKVDGFGQKIRALSIFLWKIDMAIEPEDGSDT